MFIKPMIFWIMISVIMSLLTYRWFHWSTVIVCILVWTVVWWSIVMMNAEEWWEDNKEKFGNDGIDYKPKRLEAV